MSDNKNLKSDNIEPTSQNETNKPSPPKKSRKKVIPETLVLEKPEEETISYSKAEKLTRQKRVMSAKQQENILKLIQINKERREKKAEDERKAKELMEAKAKQKVVRVLPKRSKKKKTQVIPKSDDESSSDTENELPREPIKSQVIQEPSDTEGTKVVKRKIKKLQTITNALDGLPKANQQPTNPYLHMLKLSGF
jgi:predicted Fe-S protein YdhL (DUF1289 family)